MKAQIKRTCTILALFTLGLALWFHQRTVTDAASLSNTKRAQTPTYNKEVVRLLQKNCQSCHHPGDIAPFSLTSYQETRPWAAAIREAVITKEMPPWKPLAGCGDFKDTRGLTQDEINLIAAWADGGAPEGNAADLPAPMQFSESWPLGNPDWIAQPDTTFTPPLGKDTFRCFSIPTTELRGNRFLQGLDVQPSNRKVVHHVIAFADPEGKSLALDQKEEGPGYTCFGGPGFDIPTTLSLDNSFWLGGWAPGARGYFAPDNVGIRMPAGANARVVIQVHYHPTENVESDKTAVGFYFSKQPVQQQMSSLPLVNTTFTLPAGAKQQAVTQSFRSSFPLPNIKVVGITPHMHLLGKTIKVEIERPNQATLCLVNIPSWDYNWQGSYLYKDGLPLRNGETLRLNCTFDNSADNPLNPNTPPKTVRWGEQTTDEMALAFINFTVDGQQLNPTPPSLSDAQIDAQGNLQVTGSGFLAGADIAINGQRLSDSRVEAADITHRLASSQMWKVLATPNQSVNVTVLNPDGSRSATRAVTRNATARGAAAVSAASYGATLAPEAIAAVFGETLASSTAVATTAPLPTELAGTTVRVNGVLAQLFFASRGQLNLLVPAETLPGNAVIEITTNDGTLSRGVFTVSNTAPGLFTANAAGTGTPAAVVTTDGVNYRAVANPDGSPLALNAGDYLVLFGTGFRRSSAEMATLTIGGRSLPALYVGAQGSFAGLDQLNTQLPEGLSGLVEITFSLNGKPANVVKILMK